MSLAPAGLGAELRVGRAAVKITPGPGLPMAGYYRVRLNEDVHDDLLAKAIVLESGGAKAALVACDLIGIPAEIVAKARERVTATTGVPGENVMISATHSHTGPSISSRLDGLDAKTLGLVREYVDLLSQKIAESVRLAEADLTAARVSAGIGQEDSVAFIRRFLMTDGSIGWNPGKKNPNIVRPVGEIDPAVPVVYFDSPDGEPLAAYVNYANHLDTVGGMEYSADYPFTLAKLLGAAKGPGMLTAFTIGTAGQVNHIDVKSATPQKGHDEAARIGAILAGEVLRTMRRLQSVEPGEVQASREIVPLPLAPIRSEDPDWARGVVAKYGTDDAAPFLDQVYAFKAIEIEQRQGRPIEAEVQVISLGDQIAWVGLPGEIFVELGKAIKIASPFRYTIVAELANGSIGYVPNRRAYPEGAYEVISSRVAAGGGEMLVDAAVRMLIEHRQRHLPELKGRYAGQER
jgi:hypothetical protein